MIMFPDGQRLFPQHGKQDSLCQLWHLATMSTETILKVPLGPVIKTFFTGRAVQITKTRWRLTQVIVRFRCCSQTGAGKGVLI